MSENLNIGTRIDEVTTSTNEDGVNSVIEKYCYNNNESYCDIYGGLYQWNEAMNYNEENSQGICPDGWHIPTVQEWTDLIDYINLNPNYLCNGSNVKSFATNYGWSLNTTECAIGNNQETNNATGFNIYPVGGRYYNTGSISGASLFCYLWLSSPGQYKGFVFRYNYIVSGSERSWGFSIRCINS